MIGAALGILLHLVLLLLLPFLFNGIITRVKSRWAGRQGPPLLQSLYDLTRLMRKGEVIGTTATWIFRYAPVVTLAALFGAGLLVPLVPGRALFPFAGDFVLFIYALGLAKFFSLVAAMDTGSSFEGMGASREATFSGLAEPAFMIIVASLALLTGHGSFAGILNDLQPGQGSAALVMALSALAMLIMLLVEGCRVPVDDPCTHLELTMIHEVMILDNSGPGLALLSYGAWLKMTLVAALIANLIVPAGLSPLVSLAAGLTVMALLAAVVGGIESLAPRLRLTHVPQFIFLMSSLALIIFSSLLLFVFGGLPW
jgi:formate hydrogenlyase subunit 4